MAHEAVHLLLPGAPHDSLGLMSALWPEGSLEFREAALELPPDTIRRIEAEANRRAGFRAAVRAGGTSRPLARKSGS